MTDYFGKELNIGDEVVYHNTHYREYNRGIIEKFTDKFVFLKFETYPYKIKQTPQQLIKVL